MSLPTSAQLVNHLNRGEITVTGQFMWGSNYTFFCQIEFEDKALKAVYKPVRGERPLWDFPSESLGGREVAAYLVSEGGGWGMVPPTVLRQTAPAGPGSIQLYIEHDPEYHFLSFSSADRQRARPAALFDVVVNNTDRKAGHVLIDAEDKLWLIDHGVCFHVQPKLRTVIWDFAGLPLTTVEQEQLMTLRANLASKTGLFQELDSYLSRRELQAMAGRIDQLLEAGEFPYPSEDWPSTPWPPV
ncbi:MAG: SCO1664 family protein [Anaerolineales bacterium]|nr:SCO1664 family protein [Anaerolineales bacterium]